MISNVINILNILIIRPPPFPLRTSTISPFQLRSVEGENEALSMVECSQWSAELDSEKT